MNKLVGQKIKGKFCVFFYLLTKEFIHPIKELKDNLTAFYKTQFEPLIQNEFCKRRLNFLLIL